MNSLAFGQRRFRQNWVVVWRDKQSDGRAGAALRHDAPGRLDYHPGPGARVLAAFGVGIDLSNQENRLSLSRARTHAWWLNSFLRFVFTQRTARAYNRVAAVEWDACFFFKTASHSPGRPICHRALAWRWEMEIRRRWTRCVPSASRAPYEFLGAW